MPITKPIHKLLPFYPLLLFIANVILKSLYLTAQDIGLDEPFSIYHAQFNVAALISQLKNYNNPPLFEILLHYWISVFGIAPLSVRVFPMLLAALAPVALYFFGKRHFSLSAGIAASLLLSFSSLLNYYAHNCRVYSLFLLLSILCMHFFLLLLYEKQSPANTVLFIILSSLLIYSHYFGSFILFFQGIYLLCFYRSRILKFTGYYALILLTYAPHLYPMLTRMSGSVAHGTWLKPPSGAESLYNMLWSFSNYPLVTVLCILLLFAALAKLIKNKAFFSNKKTALLLIWFLGAFFGMFLISYKIPMYISRYLIFVLPAYYLVLVACIAYLFPAGTLRTIVLAVLVTGFAFTTQLNPDKKTPVAKAVELVKQFKDEATLVLVSPYDFLPAFTYYYNRAYFSAVSNSDEYRTTDSLLQKDNVYVLNDLQEKDLATLRTFKKIVYLGNGEAAADAQQAMKLLMKDYHLTESRKLSNTYGVSVLRAN